jgi:hypothetical protein
MSMSSSDVASGIPRSAGSRCTADRVIQILKDQGTTLFPYASRVIVQ